MTIIAGEQVRLSGELKKFLDKKKIIPRETYDSVIRRLIGFKNAGKIKTR